MTASETSLRWLGDRRPGDAVAALVGSPDFFVLHRLMAGYTNHTSSHKLSSEMNKSAPLLVIVVVAWEMSFRGMGLIRAPEALIGSYIPGSPLANLVLRARGPL